MGECFAPRFRGFAVEPFGLDRSGFNRFRKGSVMDIQALFNAISDSNRLVRSDYHLTLGGLIAALEVAPAEAKVAFDHGAGLGCEDSYRGYYSDLAFTSGEVGTVADALAQCKSALNQTYEGYKGGDYVMGSDTPLWNASYGNCGAAIIGAHLSDSVVVLETKDIKL